MVSLVAEPCRRKRPESFDRHIEYLGPVRDRAKPLEDETFEVVVLDARARHAGEPTTVLLAPRVRRILDDDGPQATLMQADRGLGHAHVGLEAHHHDGALASGADLSTAASQPVRLNVDLP
jgi:hypothetical protein